MPPLPAQETHDLGEFAGFLRCLEDNGFELAVIGGMAVSVYGRLIGEPMESVDLDICVTSETLWDVVAWAPRQGFRVVKRPRPRNIQVAFLDYEGKEVNVLSGSSGLPPAEVVIRTARIFTLAEHDLEVPVADPFDLLANKLAVRRDKDLPHIDILRRFVEEEAVLAFDEETRPRARLAPIRRLIDVLGRKTLPAKLAERLVPLARTPVDFRFLVSRVPNREMARRLLEAASDGELREQLETILASRDFSEAQS